MSPYWGDVNARAQGLATHLIRDAEREALVRAPDLATLADGLREAGIDVPEDAADGMALEHALQRDAAVYVDLLVRWCGGRSGILSVVLEDEDRRSLRAILRGTAEGSVPEHLAAGLLPTPSLPAAALLELARQPTASALAALLTAWGHPLGAALMPEAASPHPDLMRLECLLNRAFAARALRQARRAGRSGRLLEEVRLTIDLENVQSALAIAEGDQSITPRDLFLPGGRRLTIDDFENVAVAGSAAAAAHRAAGCFRGTPIADALEAGGIAPRSLDTQLLRARVDMLRTARRLDPLGPASILAFMFRLRLQMSELRFAIWRAALREPPPMRATPARAP